MACKRCLSLPLCFDAAGFTDLLITVRGYRVFVCFVGIGA